MTRKIKALGLAAMAVLAVSAVAASAAQAAEIQPQFHCTSTSANCFTTSSGGTFGKGSNDHVFTVGTGAVKCTGVAGSSLDGAELKGTEAKTSTTVTLTPVYNGCKPFGIAMTIKMNGCTYTFHLAKVAEGVTTYPVSTSVTCPAGAKIELSPPGIACVVAVPAQTGITGITLKNAGTEPTHVAATIAVENIEYTETGAECASPGTRKTGKYTGTSTLTAFEDNEGREGKEVGGHVF